MDDDAELNFSFRAQAAFDNLNDGTDWTWQGLAEAFLNRYNRDDLIELRAAIDAVIDPSDDVADFNIEVLR